MTAGSNRKTTTLRDAVTSQPSEPFAVTVPVADAAAAVGRGEAVLVVDGLGPETIGMLILSAQHADAAALHRLSRLAGGDSYLALTAERCDQLGLDRVTAAKDDLVHPPATVPISAAVDIGSTIGAEHLGGTLFEVPPGEKATPYHWEAAQEEWLVVLSGTPTVRTPEGEEELAPGDLVVFPAGPEGAHQVRNASGAPCRFLMFSNRAPINAIHYPDSAKTAVRTPWGRSNFPDAAATGYWEGE